jgi:hypothetical protein
MPTTHTDILIIGAGLAGLTAANALQRAGHAPLVIDKGRSVGGRLATRRVAGGLADHGAQFFTVRDAEFKTMVDDWLKHDLAYVWSYGWSDGSTADTPRDGHPRYAIRGGLNNLAKHLAEGVDCRVNQQVAIIERRDDLWVATLADEETEYTAKVLLMTPPVPQTLGLLNSGGVLLDSSDADGLTQVTYAPCVCGMFHVEGGLYLPEPGALQRPNAEIAWIADNQRKGISPDARIITLHGGPAFSREHYDDTDAALISRFTAELVSFMNPSAHIREAHIKRWRYSQPTVLYPARCLAAKGLPLVLAGDAFGEPRVEGAVLSGLAAARAVVGMV